MAKSDPPQPPGTSDGAVVKADPQVTLPAPKPKAQTVAQAEPVIHSNPALLLSMVPASVLRQRQQAQQAAAGEKDAVHLSRAQRLATPRESKTLASLQTPALAPRPGLKPGASVPSASPYPPRPSMAMRRTNLAPDVDVDSGVLPSHVTVSLPPTQPKATSLFFSASSKTLSSTPARAEDSFADFMKDMQALGAFEAS
eukprot:GGOE01061274.1.p2 GENE.GGOE01061274.1~~GGOE01061274.1.p2  ORF type:complete len:198 (+),score=62.77 GGOE01061274.1:105-698(+)